MSLVIIECDQRSEEWHAARRGLITASAVGSLLTATGMVAKNDTSRGLIASLAAERVGDEERESFMSRDMLRGVEYEPVIRDRYAEVTGQTVREVGFLIRTLPTGARLGCSPDGLIGDVGGIEVKAPRAKGHVQTVVSDEVPAQYVAQVQAALLVTGAAWWDFVSAADGCLYVKRVYPDRVWHEAITEAVTLAENAIEQKTSDYLIRRALLPTIAPYVEHNDWELKL